MVAAAEWLNSGKDAGFLVTGSRLAQYEEWIAATDPSSPRKNGIISSPAWPSRRRAARPSRSGCGARSSWSSADHAGAPVDCLRAARGNRLRLLVATLVVFLVGAGLSLFAFSQSAERQDALATSEFNKDLARPR